VRALVLVGAIFVAGTIGYRVLEGAPWWDSFFMTVITVTTVGYEEEVPLSPKGEVFTSILLLAGLGVMLFLLTEVSRSVLEGELRQFLGRVRRSRMIERMKGHEIVCGYGRMGRAVVEELRRAGHAVVVVERSTDRVRMLQEAGIPAILGDATSEMVLREANIAHARGLVSCLNDDAHNVYTALTARSLSPKLFIVARATEEGAERRLLRAGADRVVNPYDLGGTRLAHLVVKPAIVSFFDASLGGLDLQLDQTSLRVGSPVDGTSLAEVNFRARWGLGVVAVQRDTEIFPNPGPQFKLQGGDVLVVFGRRDQISAFEAECGQRT
jgi:voltage-gated potassium channel